MLVPHSVEIVLQAHILKVFGRVVLRGQILQVVALLEFLVESLSLFFEVLDCCIPLEHHVPNVELGPSNSWTSSLTLVILEHELTLEVCGR